MAMREVTVDDLRSGKAATTGGGRLLDGEVTLPAAVLIESALRHNLDWMQRFVDAYGLTLAPHGKTTMAPALFRRQIAGGAWGITVATVQQAWVAAAHGIDRVLVANQIVGAANIALAAELIARDGTELFCLIDSADGAEQLAAGMRARGVTIDVLLEVAPTRDQHGARAGVRDDAQQAATLAAIAAGAPHIRLAGVEVYEGVLVEEDEIRAYLARAACIAAELARGGAFGRSPAILTGAGSAWYDVVAEVFGGLDRSLGIEVVLRPGCYLTHDAGLYRNAQAAILARNPVAARMRGGLRPALQIWAAVQSRPDPDRAVVAMGKRDVAFDAGLPMPILHCRPGRDEVPAAAPPGWRVTGMMDQHAALACAKGDDLRVGDLIGFDVSHPCLTFDKWRTLLIVDDDLACIERIETFF
jgi:D-serine dehydratase